MIDWKLKDFTEEEQREKFENVHVENVIPQFLSIRNERAQDISGIKDIVYRDSGKAKNIILRNSARKKPEDVVPERSINIQQMVKAGKEKTVEDLRFFKSAKNRPRKPK